MRHSFPKTDERSNESKCFLIIILLTMLVVLAILCKRKQTKGTCAKTNIIFMIASRSEIACFIYGSKWFPLPRAHPNTLCL